MTMPHLEELTAALRPSESVRIEDHAFEVVTPSGVVRVAMGVGRWLWASADPRATIADNGRALTWEHALTAGRASL